MSKVERLYHLHNILNQRRTPISRKDLMERLECSQATLYRLVAELRDFLGAPLEQDEDNRGFYYDRSYDQPFELPGIWISPEELQAKTKFQMDNYGMIIFSFFGIQQEVFQNSYIGKSTAMYLHPILIRPTAPNEKPLGGNARKIRAREIEEILD